MNRQLKPRDCRQCGESYSPRTSLQSVCSLNCTIAQSRKKRDRINNKTAKAEIRAEKAALRQRKEAIKTRSQWLRELQTLVNRYVRLRDALRGDGCISCDKPATWQGQWHCSHHYSVGSSSAVRFNLWNLHKSCSVCNSHLSGNVGEYTPRLIEKIGQKRYNWLEENHSNIVKYDIDWIKRAIKVARKGIKRLEKRRECSI